MNDRSGLIFEKKTHRHFCFFKLVHVQGEDYDPSPEDNQSDRELSTIDETCGAPELYFTLNLRGQSENSAMAQVFINTLLTLIRWIDQ
jgi:hypothetical protein